MPPMDFAQTRNLEVIAKNEIFLNRFNGEKILLLSPNIHDFLFWKKLLPNADFTISTKFDWDLEEKISDSRFANSYDFGFDQTEFKLFDLTIAQNVFMYIKNPTQAAKNISMISDNLFIQDLKYRKRSFTPTGLGLDGDISRYSITKDQVNHPTIHILSEVFKPSRIIAQIEYEGATNEYHGESDTPRHILALLELVERNSYAPFSRNYARKSIIRLKFRTYCSSWFSKIHFLKI